MHRYPAEDFLQFRISQGVKKYYSDNLIILYTVHALYLYLWRCTHFEFKTIKLLKLINIEMTVSNKYNFVNSANLGSLP